MSAQLESASPKAQRKSASRSGSVGCVRTPIGDLPSGVLWKMNSHAVARASTEGEAPMPARQSAGELRKRTTACKEQSSIRTG